MTTLKWCLAALLVGLVGGLGLGYRLYRGNVAPTVVDKPLPQVNLPNGAVEATVAPSAQQPVIVGLPKTQTVIRTVYVTVQPDKPVEDGYSTDKQDTPEPKPIKIAVSFVRQENSTLRAVITSDGDKILAAVDVPKIGDTITVAAPAPKELNMAAGAVYGTTAWGDTAKGMFVDRDLGAFRTGVEVTRNTYSVANRIGWEVRAKIGFRFNWR
jgi:hypothetical protein